jgi:hypothetical protein
VPLSEEAKLVEKFGAIKKENDRSDVRFLAALDAKAVDFVVTQDVGLHRRAERAGLGASVFTIEEALQWLKQSFIVKAVMGWCGARSALQPQHLFNLRDMRESRNFRPIRNDTDAENYYKSNQQCETRWSAVMLVFIDIRHDIYLRSNPSISD